MYSLSTLAGTESASFFASWETVKDQFEKILNNGPKITALWRQAKARLANERDPAKQKQLRDQLYRLSAMNLNWQEVKAKIDEWRPKWTRVANIASDDLGSGVGLIPFILPAWALASLVGGGLAALTYVTVQGMNLIKQYQAEQIIYDRLASGVLTERGAQGMIEALQPKGLDPFQMVAGGLSNIVPMVAGVGLLVMFGPMLMARMAK